jgi:hypothetical protein
MVDASTDGYSTFLPDAFPQNFEQYVSTCFVHTEFARSTNEADKNSRKRNVETVVDEAELDADAVEGDDPGARDLAPASKQVFMSEVDTLEHWKDCNLP